MSIDPKDLSYISDPFRWAGIFCPLKRRKPNSNWYEFAYMIGDGPNIYHGNMYTASKSDKRESFSSYEAILQAGWEVD